MQTLLDNVKFEEAIAGTNRVAGTTDINGIATDMTGFEGVLCRLEMGPITSNAVTSLKGQESDATATGWTDIAGSSITIPDDHDDDYVNLDVANIRKRYFRLVVDRATQNATIRSAQYIKYNPSFAPTTQPTDDLSLTVTPA